MLALSRELGNDVIIRPGITAPSCRFATRARAWPNDFRSIWQGAAAEIATDAIGCGVSQADQCRGSERHRTIQNGQIDSFPVWIWLAAAGWLEVGIGRLSDGRCEGTRERRPQNANAR